MTIRRQIASLLASVTFLAQVHAEQITVTPAGSGGGGGGTVIQVNTSCGVLGGPITSSGTIQGSTVDNTARSFSGTTDIVASGDCGFVNDYTNVAAVTVTVPSPSGFPTGYSVTIKSNGSNTGGVTLTPSGTTIDGSSSSIALATGNSLDLYINAAGAWGTIYKPGSGGGGTPGGSSGDLQTNNGSGGFGSLKTNAALGHGSYATGRFYGTWPGSVVVGGNPGNNSIIFYPFFISQTLSLTSLNIYVTTAGTASSAMVGLYADASGLPSGSALCVPAASQATTSTGNIAFPVSCALTGPGWYWAAVNVSHTTNAVMMALGGAASTASSFLSQYLVGASTAAIANGSGTPVNAFVSYSAVNTVVSGAMPAISSLTLTQTTSSGTAAHVVLGD